jgi:hypothetical protein
MSWRGYSLVPSSWDLQHLAVYARGKEVRDILFGPITLSGIREDVKRSTPASRQFDLCFDREPVAGDVLHFRQVALVNHPDLIEFRTKPFIEAWGRRLKELPCPLKAENGRLFERVTRSRPSSAPEWVEDISVQPEAIWLEIEKDIKWRELGMPLNRSAEALGLSLETTPSIPAVAFLGLGPESDSTGMVKEKHRCRPATEEEMRQPEIEPPKGSLLAILQEALKRADEAGQVKS